MFNGANRHTIFVADGGAQHGIDHPVPGRRDHGTIAFNISALKNNPAVFISRIQSHGNFFTGVQTNARARNRRLQSRLKRELDRLYFGSSCCRGNECVHSPQVLIY